MSEKKETIGIGIDLGTTYSCVGVWRSNINEVEIIANELGERTTPSCVAFTDTERLLGRAAMNQASRNPENTIFDAKRLIGRTFKDPTVQSDMKHWPFKVVDNKGKPVIQVQYQGNTKTFGAEEISSFVLTKMRATAETRIGSKVKNAVITVPAYFNDAQRQATKDAGAIAGLNVLRIINEPTAAALAYGLKEKKDDDDETNVLIFDLGGGTFDVSILCLEDGVFEVKATAGNTHLGGEDFDNNLVDYCIAQFKKKNPSEANTNFRERARCFRRLRTSCERAKRELSTKTKATVQVDSFAGDVDLELNVTRARFERLCNDYFNSCMETVKLVLADAKMSKKEISEVVLVGGSSRIPKVQSLLKSFFGGKELNQSINPDEAVASGAAVQAYILSGGKSLGGAQIVLLDVTPLSLGLETVGNVMTKIIERNTPIPCIRTSVFSTNEDNQEAVSIRVYEGERGFVKDNNEMGRFCLQDIPKAPRGVPQIKVKFSLDANGILNVSASESKMGGKAEITIRNDSGRLSKEEIESMVKSANSFQAEDDKRRKQVDSRNQLESYCHKLKNGVPKDGRFSEEDKKAVKTNVDQVLDWLSRSGNAQAADYQKKTRLLEGVLKPIIARIKKEQEAKKDKGKD